MLVISSFGWPQAGYNIEHIQNIVIETKKHLLSIIPTDKYLITLNVRTTALALNRYVSMSPIRSWNEPIPLIIKHI